jgi:hypothetical protein
MADLMAQAIADGSVHLRWREPYVTEGVSELGTALPAGCYRGFGIVETLVPSWGVRLGATIIGLPAGVYTDSLLMYVDETTGYGLAVREPSDVVLDLAGTGLVLPLVAAVDLWIWTEVLYTPNVATVANYRVSDADPRVAHPSAVVIGVLHVDVGASVVRLTTPVINAAAYYVAPLGDRTVPLAAAREQAVNYVVGDRPLGLLAGTERWCLPTRQQKLGLDNAATAVTGGNPVVTEADTLDKVFAEPTVASVVVAAGVPLAIFDFATYGAMYLGLGGVGTAQQYFDVRLAGSDRYLTTEDGSAAEQIALIVDPATMMEINPAAVCDANGFYAGDIWITFAGGALSATNPVTVDVWYGRRQTFNTLDSTPAFGLARVAPYRHDHAALVAANVAVTPPGCIIKADATVQDEINRLRQRTRASHSMDHTDSRMAAKLFLPTETYAQPFGDASQETLESATWPRCMCYGVNDAGIVVAEGLTGGERFLLYSYTDAVLGREAIRRYTITDGETLQGPATIDVIPTINAAIPIGHRPALVSDWNIVSMASDGRYVYIRAMGYTGGDPDVHALACYDIVNRTSVWVPVEIASGTTGMYEPHPNNALHVIVADVAATKLALNLPWQDLKVGGAGQGIEIRSTVDGSLISTGYGDAVDVGWTAPDAYAAGPMCSDGTNIYFEVRCYDSGGGPFTGKELFGVGQCTIANPTLHQAGAEIDTIDLTLWNPDTATESPTPRSLVFDGELCWLMGRFAVVIVNPVPGANGTHFFKFTDSVKKYMFGPAAFDGKHIYFGLVSFDALLVGDWYYHIVRINPATIPAYVDFTAETDGDILTYIDPGWRCLCEMPSDVAITWTGLYAFGDTMYDGDTLWYTKQWWGNGATLSGNELLLQRIPNVHGV